MTECCDKEEKLSIKKINRISVADFEVTSSEASLKEVEETMNRMVEKHKEFSEKRRIKVISEHQGMIG